MGDFEKWWDGEYKGVAGTSECDIARDAWTAAEKANLQKLAAAIADGCRQMERAKAALRHIAAYPNITATAMRDCAREALK